jgi:uncharacterized protein (DUF1697 family)
MQVDLNPMPVRKKAKANSVIFYQDQEDSIAKIIKETNSNRANVLRAAMDFYIKAWEEANAKTTRRKKGN